MTALAQAIPEFELTYFNGRGFAETSRILLALADQPFTDTRFPIKVIDFSTYSFERKEFDEAKNNGKLVKSIGKVPFLKVNDVVIPQSKAIERYLARRFGFMGKTEEEGALIDAFCEHILDIKTAYQTPRKIKDNEEREEALDRFFNTFLPARLQAIVESIDDAEFVIGNKISLADISLYGLVAFFDNQEGILGALPDTLKTKYETVAQHPKVKTWVATRPATPF